MSLRPLLQHLTDDAEAAQLRLDAPAGASTRAFVSQALRPYVVAGLADTDPGAATLVVAGDDKQARDLAADLAV